MRNVAEDLNVQGPCRPQNIRCCWSRMCHAVSRHCSQGSVPPDETQYWDGNLYRKGGFRIRLNTWKQRQFSCVDVRRLRLAAGNRYSGRACRHKVRASGSWRMLQSFNPLTPKDFNSGRTAPLTSKRCILYIYSTNTGTEYFKHGIYCPFFPLQNAVCFIILTYLVPVLFTFYI